jgi:HSP20 family molecular chaperone IbpA
LGLRATNKALNIYFLEDLKILTLRQSSFDLFERLKQQLATAERSPTAEIVETETAYTIRLELPGVDKNSIDEKLPTARWL